MLTKCKRQCVPPAGNSTNVGGSRERTWFHESYEQVKSGVDYIRLREYVWECTQTLDEHPTAWLQPLDGEYGTASEPKRMRRAKVLQSSLLPANTTRIHSKQSKAMAKASGANGTTPPRLSPAASSAAP